MKEHLQRYGATWLLVAATFIAPLAVYHRLPEVVPTHWDIAGHVDHYEPRFIGVFMVPLASVGVTLALIFGGWFARRNGLSPPSMRYWPLVVLLAAATQLFLVVQQLRAALGHAVDMPGSVLALVGIAMVASGNYLGKVTRNRVFGIRTPWTLASDHVWERTHRLCGPLFVLAGLGFLLMACLPGHGGWLPLALLAIVLVVPFFHSWRVARQENSR